MTLCALAIDVLGLDASSSAIHRLLAELAVDDTTTVEHTIEAAALLRAAASDVDGYDRAETTQLAAHIGDAHRAGDGVRGGHGQHGR